LNKTPVYLLSAFGAMTAVLMLVFKDTILGLVASIQMSANDMVRVGDWVEMPKFNADGNVIAINLNTTFNVLFGCGYEIVGRLQAIDLLQADGCFPNPGFFCFVWFTLS
jgi:hypothetical protein